MADFLLDTNVIIDFLRGFKVAGASRQMQKFLQLYQNQKWVNLPRGVTIEDADIFIAAISMVNECTLVTSNVRHFSRVEGLNFVNWRLP